MQASQVKEHFPHVKQCIDNAAQLCRITKDVPDELRDSVSELGRESEQAKQVFEQGRDEEHIRQCVTRLEELGDRTLQTCKDAGKLDWDVQSAVREAHDAISELKQQLH